MLISNCNWAFDILNGLMVLHCCLWPLSTCQSAWVSCVCCTWLFRHVNSIHARVCTLSQLICWSWLLFLLIRKWLGCLVRDHRLLITSNYQWSFFGIDIFCWNSTITYADFVWTIWFAKLWSAVCFSICFVAIHHIDSFIRVHKISFAFFFHCLNMSYHSWAFALLYLRFFDAPLCVLSAVSILNIFLELIQFLYILVLRWVDCWAL